MVRWSTVGYSGSSIQPQPLRFSAISAAAMSAALAIDAGRIGGIAACDEIGEPGTVQALVAAGQRIARQAVVIGPKIIQDQCVLVDREVLMIRADAVERAKRLVGDSAQRREPRAETVTVVPEHRILVMIQTPVVFRIDGARGKIAGVAVGRRQAGLLAPSICQVSSPTGRLRREITIGRLLAGAALPVERVIENGAVPARVHADLVDRGGGHRAVRIS